MMTTPDTPERIKSCCAAAYDDDLVALVLGESYHPGGAALTRRLAERAGVRPNGRVLDVAAGPGGTALLLAREYGARVDGIDLGERTTARARATAEAAGLAERVSFHRADAERLPFPDATFDTVICECALCTFPDKSTAAAEIARVLRPGGHAGITDITADHDRLDPVLTGLTGWIACLADARTTAGYTTLLTSAGLRVSTTESHDDALTAMIDQIDARLRALRMTPAGRHIDPAATAAAIAAARTAVTIGTLGYALLSARKPGSGDSANG